MIEIQASVQALLPLDLSLCWIENIFLNKFRKNNGQLREEVPSDKLEQIKKLFNKEYKHRFMVKVGNQFKSFNVEDLLSSNLIKG
jgi:sugar diacid utilization regulator